MVKAGFTRKKVESMTLGEKLKKIRSEYRISLNEVAKQTKIQIKYLEFLENGEYEKLPAEVYVRGFVRSYAHFLGTDESVLVKLYEHERHIQKNIKKEQFQDTNQSHFNFPHFIITPKLFVVSGIVLLTLGGFVYLYREFQSFASVPRLSIQEPLDGSIVQSREVDIKGNTEKDASVVINGQPVLVREGGDFYEQVHLQSGLNTFTVIATNKFKKEKSVTFSVQANFDTQESFQVETVTPLFDTKVSNAKTVFEISVELKSITVDILVDGEKAYSGVMVPGAKQLFEAQKTITVSTSDGKHTLIRMNDGRPQSVDTSAKQISEKIYTAESFVEPSI